MFSFLPKKWTFNNGQIKTIRHTCRSSQLLQVGNDSKETNRSGSCIQFGKPLKHYFTSERLKMFDGGSYRSSFMRHFHMRDLDWFIFPILFFNNHVLIFVVIIRIPIGTMLQCLSWTVLNSKPLFVNTNRKWIEVYI